MSLADLALSMMREDPALARDARRHSKAQNTVLGSVLSIVTLHPRGSTEQAVAAALARFEAEVTP